MEHNNNKLFSELELSTYTMKSSISMDLALFSLNSATCRTLSIFLVMLKSAGISCSNDQDEQNIDLKICILIRV